MFSLGLFRELASGYRYHGWGYLMSPLPVLSAILASILGSGAIAAIVYLPLPLMLLCLVVVAIMTLIAFFHR